MDKYLSEIEFWEFAQRSSEYIRLIDSYEGNKSDIVDVNLIEVIKKLNKIPGVATVFSCEGHYETNDRELMIVLACTEKGEDNLKGIMLSLFNRLDTRLRFGFSLQFCFLLHPEKPTPYIAKILKCPLPFKARGSSGHCTLSEYNSVKMSFIATLDEILKIIFDQNKIKPIYGPSMRLHSL